MLKKYVVLSFVVLLCICGCGKKEGSGEKNVSEVNDNPSVDSQVNQTSESGIAKQENNQQKLTTSDWTSGNEGDKFVIDGLVFEYGMTPMDFSEVIKTSPNADDYLFGYKPDQLCACYKDKPAMVYTEVKKGGEVWFAGVFSYPACDDDAVPFEKTYLIGIEPYPAALDAGSYLNEE